MVIVKSQICPGPDGELHHNAVCPVDLKTVPGGSLPDIQNTDFTIEFLKNRSMDNKPFFVGMGYHKPHLPFAYPKKYLGQEILKFLLACLHISFTTCRISALTCVKAAQIVSKLDSTSLRELYDF